MSAQEKWPSHRVTIVVPFAAGSNTDACARLLAELLGDIHGQSFIVENRGGAGGTLGANAVAKSSPDGYTLLMAGNTSLSAAPALFKNVPYDPINDFTAIARVGRFSSVLVTTPQQPFRTMQEFVAYAKANQGKLSYGHGNSTGHIVGEAIKKRTGVEMTRVPYTATPASSIKSKAHMNTLWSLSHRRISSKQAIPSSPHATASPSTMQDPARSRARASTIRGKRAVRSLPGRL
jgi:tripartite-type tricarboxylate transporter receptor subunit TctC